VAYFAGGLMILLTSVLRPAWQTPKGNLGSFAQSVAITPIELTATNTSRYEILSGNLPTGLKLNKDSGRIEGTPIDINISRTYEFAVRASNFSGIGGAKVVQDRTFTITILSGVAPELLTPEGYLNIGYNNENYVLNDSTINFQFQASATSIPVGQKLKFYVEEGTSNLPPGLKLSSSGLLYGTIKDDLELDYKIVNGAYDKDYYDMNPYDYGAVIEPATAITEITNGQVTNTILTASGYGYLLDPEIIIGGSIDSVNVITSGLNYTVAPEIIFSPSPTVGGRTAKGYAVLGDIYGANGTTQTTIIDGEYSSTIASQTVDGGTAFSLPLDFTDGGAGNVIIYNVTGKGVVEIVVTDPGTGYRTPPTVYIKETDLGAGATADCSLMIGSGAVINAHVTNGNVVELEIINPGSNYDLPPLISFGLPTVGPKILSKTYRFSVTVSNGELTDTKTYSIIVNSEDSLRADTTFISSDSVEYDSSSTYVQAPIWITGSVLPLVKGNNNITIDLDIFDPTPDVGEIQFTLMPTNFDGSLSQFGPVNINSTLDAPYDRYLTLDPIGGEISGLVPYQPAVSRDYVFTVKCARIVDGIEAVTTFKQFLMTVEGNIQSKISYITDQIVGTLTPNEQSLLKIVASSSLPSASVNYQLIPGYGTTKKQDYVELTLNERNGRIYVEGYGIDPTLILEKGQAYKINVSLINFSASFRTLNDDYYSIGLRHSDNTIGNAAQEKNTGYFIFNVPFDEAEKIKLHYSNTKKDGLFVVLNEYNEITKIWERQEFKSFFNEYDATTYYEGKEAYAYFLTGNKIQFTTKKYNATTRSWEIINIPTQKSLSPVQGDLWLDLENSNFGVLEYRYVVGTTSAAWFAVQPPVVTIVPNNSVGANGSYVAVNNINGVFDIYRRVNGQWKLLEVLKYNVKSTFDPNIFFKPHTKSEPVTNLQYDVWWKYTTPYDGFDDETLVTIRELGNIPSEISLSLDGEIVGKISPGNTYVYRSIYKGSTQYTLNDVITFGDDLYVCINQHVTSGLWLNDRDNWSLFTFPKKIITSIDQNKYGSNSWTLDANETTIDGKIRFRVRAKDSQNVSYADKDFDIIYNNNTNKSLTNIYLQPFLAKNSRDLYFNFITDPNIFINDYLYRSNDTSFGVQRTPKMLLLGGIESTLAERYASAVVKNYYDRPLYFGDIKTAVAKTSDGKTEYEIVYVEIVDPYEINGISVSEQIKLPFNYDILSTDYSKIRVDESTMVNDLSKNPIGLDTIFPSSITLMQKELENVTLQRVGSFSAVPLANIEDWGGILDVASSNDDWGQVAERVFITDDFLLVIEALTKDNKFRPLWMNTSQDGSGVPVGFTKAVPICYVKPGYSDRIVSIIKKSGFDFKQLNFTIDRIIIQNPQGVTGDKYIKFTNREII
jgi:hypothetical protein